MSDYLNTTTTDWYKQRVIGVLVCVLTAFAVLAIRLFYLQIIEGEELRRLSESNSIRLQDIDPPRGLIFDRTNTLIVDNRPSFDLGIIVKDAKPVEETIEKLSQYTGIPAAAMMDKIKTSNKLPAFKPILLKSDIGRNALAAIETHKFDLPGVVVNIQPLRHYIFKQSASHLLGYLGEINPTELAREAFVDYKAGDLIGKFGVEKTYEPFLRGRRGGRQVEVNATGQVVRVLKTVEGHPGKNLYLTIDYRIQQKAEELLEGQAGAVAAIDPNSGAVLALASSPSFDQNIFVGGLARDDWNMLLTNPYHPMENKSIQGEYPPGSTYKIVTAIAGLEEGVLDETTTVHCPGQYRFGDRIFRCWKKGGHGKVDLIQAIEQSCDVYFYQAGQNVGVDRLAWYAKACGLGSPAGINLSHEAKGLIPTAAWKKRRFGIDWQRGETLSIAIGQGYNLTTPLQMAVLTGAVANGGTRYKPIIMNKIQTADGEMVVENKSEMIGQLPVSAKTLDLVRIGLRQVVAGEKGTARGSRVESIDISGKTGTSQVVGRKKNSDEEEEERPDHLKAHAWFVAYAPSDNPQIAVAVIVEHGEHGSSAAAPIAREVIKTYLLDQKSIKEQVG